MPSHLNVRTTVLLLLAPVVSHVWQGAPASAPARLNTAQCSIELGASVRVKTRDGAVVHVNTQSVEESQGVTLVMGTPTVVWQTVGSTSRYPRPQEYVGVEIDSTGVGDAIESPLPKVHFINVIAARATPNGWHVILIAADSGTTRGRPVADSSTIWYGRYANGAWHGVAQVAHPTYAGVANRFLSNLIARGDELTFAFAFDIGGFRRSNARGNQGVVLARRIHSAWRFDTLQTRLPPSAVTLAQTATSATISAGIVQEYFDEHLLPRTSSYFLASFDSVWRVHGRVGGDGASYVAAPPILVLTPRSRIVAWAVPARSVIEFRELSTTDTTTLNSGEAKVNAVRRFTLGVQDDSTLIIAGALRQSGDSILFVVRRGGREVLKSEAAVPNQGLQLRLVRAGSGMVAVTSQVFAVSDAVPAATVLTPVRYRCK